VLKAKKKINLDNDLLIIETMGWKWHILWDVLSEIHWRGEE
jgi:hypothetical protein